MAFLKIIKIISASITIFVSSIVFAADPVNTGLLGNTAIKGYDTVAYHTQNAPVKGSKEFSSEYNGAKWLFSSAENKALFDANPEKYEPQYGGYCAYAVSIGKTAKIDPAQFTIFEDKLYLNYNEDIMHNWRKDKAGNIVKANANWPAVLND